MEWGGKEVVWGKIGGGLKKSNNNVIMLLMNENDVRQKIKGLVDKYQLVQISKKIKTYSEEDTIKDFILPLFEALGWDTANKEEVSAQDHIKGSGRPDYNFKINGVTQFYLEAKKLAADLDDEEFAHQAINYSWNKGVTYAILTDFQGIKVFNAQRIEKIDSIDKLVFELPYEKYLSDFETLWLLSRDSFLDKRLDAFAEKHGKKEKSVAVATVIQKLNQDIQWCREELTHTFKICNQEKNLPQDLIDEGVQKLLDRLIFLRVAEDRGVEPTILKNLLREAEKNKSYTPFKEMISIFRELDKTYDSNLFSPHPFEGWEEWNGSLKKVIERLYGKKGYYEYNFKEMPADVLGSVYENYLSYKLSTTKSKNKKLFGNNEEIVITKDARKRKEQGIYYTPRFVVDYIVQDTLKLVLDNCISIGDLKRVKILDPACGSGSFLIKALETLYEKYKEFGSDNEYLKRIIILDTLFGVDLDQQAVEIARLNLLINSLDTKDILPSLGKNIKRGNSLISGSEKELKGKFGKNWRDKCPFNWQEEFPEVFKQGGFDIIIGNPPYIKEFVNKDVFDGLHDNPYYQGKMDIWTMFGCIAIDLLKEGGILSFIAPNNWISNAGASIFRDKVLTEGELTTYIDFGDYKVFEQAGIQTMIFIFQKGKPREKYMVNYFKVNDKNIGEDKLIIDIFGAKQTIEIEPKKYIDKTLTFSVSESNSIFDKIETKKNFELTNKEIAQGIVADPDKAFIFKEDEDFLEEENKILKPYYTSVGRYMSGEKRGLLAYLNQNDNNDIEKFPHIKNQLLKYNDELLGRRETKNGRLKWFNLHWPRDEKFFTEGEKIIGGIRVSQPSFYYTKEAYYGSRALNFIKTDRINLKYLSGILNSKLSFFWLKNKGKQLGDLLQVDKGPLLSIPVYVGSTNQQKNIITLVDTIISLYNELQELPEYSEKWGRVQSEIERVDQKINKEIYLLYELTEEEIKVVERNYTHSEKDSKKEYKIKSEVKGLYLGEVYLVRGYQRTF